MENLNKIISLVIGLVIVVVVFAVLTGRINLRSKIMKLGVKNSSASPTPSITPNSQVKQTPTPTLGYKVNRYQQSVGGQKPQIPATGTPLILYSSLFAILSAGIYLRGRK